MSKDYKANLYKGKIFSFISEKENIYSLPKLKSILAFLKQININKYIQSFSLVSENDHPIAKLSMQESLFLEALPTYINENKDNVFERFLAKNRNLYFQELFTKFPHWNKLPTEIDNKDLALFSLLKAITKKSELIIIENPSLIFKHNHEGLIQKALIYEALHNKITIIMSHQTSSSTWQQISDFTVIKEVNRPFKVTPIEENKISSDVTEIYIEKKSA